MRYATVEWQAKPEGPRRIDRFEYRPKGGYEADLPKGARVVSVWVPSKGKTDEENV